jgi:hypothetical protein
VDDIPPLNRIAAQPGRVDKADGSDSGRVMAALSDAAVIDVTAADQSRVKAGCRTRGDQVKMPWQPAACSGLKCAIPVLVACSSGSLLTLERARGMPGVVV